MIQRRALFPLATATLAAPYLSTARAQGTILKLAFADTQSHPVYDVLQRFAANVRARTNGAADLHVFSIGQLGSGTNIMTGLQTGIIDFCAHTSGFIDTAFPQFQVVDLPFLFASESAAERVLDGPIGRRLLDMMPTKGIYGLAYGHWGWRVVSTLDRKIPSPGDIRGLKLRVQPGAIFSATFQALGAIPTAIDLTEVYLALSQKVIGAVETPVISVAATKQDEIITTINETNHVYNVGVLMASKAKFDRLAPAAQEAIRTASHELTADWRTTIAAASKETTARFQQKGMAIVPVEREAYRAATEGIYQQFRSIVGTDLYDAVVGEAAHG